MKQPQNAQAPRQTVTQRWNGTRRRILALFFGRLFGTVGSRLCEPGQLPRRGIHRVLVCRPNHRLGNAILISPLLAEIEALYPGAEIDIVAGGHAAQTLFSDRFQVRQVLSLPRKMARHPWITLRLLRQLRRDTYDLAIDACNDSQSGRLLLAIAKARFKLGFPDVREGSESAWKERSCPEHFAHRGVFLLRTAYAEKIDRAYPPLNLRVSEVEKQEARRTLIAILGESRKPADTRPVIGIFTNATGAKCYDEAWWTQFVSTLQTLQPEVQIVDLVAEHGQSQLGGNHASYYTRDLRRLASMISNMDGFISADCGVMHLAVASGTPTLGLFSATSPDKYGPDGSANAAVDTRAMSTADVAAIASDWYSLSVPGERRGEPGLNNTSPHAAIQRDAA